MSDPLHDQDRHKAFYSDFTPSLASGRLTIDLSAFADNWRFLRDQMSTQDADAPECAAVIKADAYGITLEHAVETLTEAGCRTYFVATPQEALSGRGLTEAADIFVLNGLAPGAASFYRDNRLQPVLNSMPEIHEWAAEGGFYPAALHIDTGMNRLGLREEEARALAANKALCQKLNLSLIMSHLACADTPRSLMNGCQLSSFQAIAGLFPGVRRSLANSAGIFNGAAFHMNLARPGIALYGGAALAIHVGDNPMKPVVKAEARVLQVRAVKQHESVGYSAAEVVERDCLIAILSVGYADGYLRRAGSTTREKGASVFLRGQAAPLVGRVSMDMIAVDVTAIAGVTRGDYAEVFGPNIPVSVVAGHARTIDYEFLTGLGKRYTRHYGPL
ncbi:MAG: alanine racemase [Rhizobiales bacterium]|nr:alanine racemase [Hyphomicrobiales bacterium]